MSVDNHSLPPIINKQKPLNARQKLFQEQKPSQTAWLTTFKRILKNSNIRYALLWLTGGIIFSLYGKRAIRRREEELMMKDIENYLQNKKKE